MNQIEIKIRFRAGHRLIKPYEGKCNNVHGEGYTAICFLEGDLNKSGMVIDFGEAKKKINEWIDNNWDHAYIYNEQDYIGKILLNERFKVYSLNTNPTAECMAKHLFEVIKDRLEMPIKRVGIIESFEDSIAWFNE